MEIKMQVLLTKEEENKLKEAQKVVSNLCESMEGKGECSVCPLKRKGRSTCYGAFLDDIVAILCEEEE